MPKNNAPLAYVGIIAVIVVVGFALIYLSNGSAPAGQTSVMLTDPPSVPFGTTALVAAYSSVQVHYAAANGTSGWAYGSGGGTVDLMSLVNVSQTIANVKLASNTTVNQVRFNLTSVSITINGTSYPVLLSQSTITANVSGSQSVNGSSSILVDLSPTVVVIYTNSSLVFVMVPSVKAVVVPGVGVLFGGRAQLSDNDREHLNQAGSISITGSSLSYINSTNTTMLSVTVMNEGNSTVLLKHVLLYGQRPILFSASERMNDSMSAYTGIGANVSANAYGSAGLGSQLGSDDDLGAQANSNMSQSAMFPFGERLDASQQARAFIAISPIFRVLNFMVEANGSLALPFLNPSPCSGSLLCIQAQIGNDEDQGYSLAPGQSVTLSFDGQISYGNSWVRGRILPGKYDIIVSGTRGTYSSTTVNATT